MLELLLGTGPPINKSLYKMDVAGRMSSAPDNVETRREFTGELLGSIFLDTNFLVGWANYGSDVG